MLKYRHTTVEDIPKIDEWIAADPVHKDVMTGADFVLVPDENNHIPKGLQCIEVEDERGIVFYLRFKNALIVETQFPPATAPNAFGALKHELRIAKALKEAFGYFAASSKTLGYHAMFFNSVSASLIGFFNKLGFQKVVDYFKVDL